MSAIEQIIVLIKIFRERIFVGNADLTPARQVTPTPMSKSERRVWAVKRGHRTGVFDKQQDALAAVRQSCRSASPQAY